MRSKAPHREPSCISWTAATTIARHSGSCYSVSSSRTAYVGSLSRRPKMKKSLVSALTVASMALLMAGCGLAEVGVSAATQGASAAEQAKQAKETEAKFQQKLDQANQAAAAQRAKAEEQSQ